MSVSVQSFEKINPIIGRWLVFENGH